MVLEEIAWRAFRRSPIVPLVGNPTVEVRVKHGVSGRGRDDIVGLHPQTKADFSPDSEVERVVNTGATVLDHGNITHGNAQIGGERACRVRGGSGTNLARRGPNKGRRMVYIVDPILL